MEQSNFREYLPDLTSPRFQIAKTQTPYEYAEAFNREHSPPWLYNLTEAWKDLLREQFTGVTNDGHIKEKLFQLSEDGVDVRSILAAVTRLFDVLSTDQKSKLQYSINSREWRAWSNPEVLLRPFGLRLEEEGQDIADAVLAIVKATLSPAGYEKALAAMRINHFLGEICELPSIMNEYSYNFLIFGKPSETQSWGWSMYGHHLCLNVYLKGNYIAISPTFTGAEPNMIDAGPWKGTQILHTEGDLGLKLMQSISQPLKDKAQIYKQLHDPGMLQSGDLKIDRWNKDDQRHLCGAFRDNRIVPYEGIVVADLGPSEQQLVLDIAEQFLLYYPDTARRTHMQQIKSFLNETYFSWIGEYGPNDAFYYRLQSPVIVLEFDHHSGVFLSNSEPAKFHTHTIMRIPNGGDYGNAVRLPEEKLE